MTKPGGSCRSGRRRDNAAAARARLAQSQAPGTHGRRTAAVAAAKPQTITGVPIRRELAEHLTAPQRG